MSRVKSVSLRDFRSEVTAAALPVVVDFYASWCGPCRVLAPILEQVAARYDGKLKIVKVNIDEEPELAEYFRVSGVPMLSFFKAGKVVDQLVGLPGSHTLIHKIDSLVGITESRMTR